VVLFSDGEDNSSWLGDKQIQEMVERSNALVHVVAAGSSSAESTPVSQSPDFSEALRVGERVQSQYTPRFGRPDSIYVGKLRKLAETTGGSLVEVNSPARLEAAFTEIIEAMKNRYVLRYDPENPGAGFHKLELQLRSGKGKVRGRTGYWVETR
jgi:VWFA-related protein